VTGGGAVSPPPPDGFEHGHVDAGSVRLHVVVGGHGPPVLLICGWPQTWFAWRLVMPRLAAAGHRVVAVDPRGVGGSETPTGGYDTGTLASDMVALMAALGHERFAVVGHDVGLWTGYAIAADHPDHVERLAVAEAVLPGVSPAPLMLGPAAANARLWHFAFNRLDTLNEQLVRGREHLYFGYQFESKAVVPLAADAVEHYVAVLRSPDALRCSFAFYRALDQTMTQNERRAQRRLSAPVLAIGGERWLGERVAETMRIVSDSVGAVSIPGCGHYPAEEAPDAVGAALVHFLAA
jgi:pimeloyl-ACP methyl ester carboxylesterase